MRGHDKYTILEKAKDIILEPQNYIELIKGNKLKKHIHWMKLEILRLICIIL